MEETLTQLGKALEELDNLAARFRRIYISLMNQGLETLSSTKIEEKEEEDSQETQSLAKSIEEKIKFEEWTEDEIIKRINQKFKGIRWDNVVNFGKLKEKKVTYRLFVKILMKKDLYSTIHPIVRSLVNQGPEQYSDANAYATAKGIVLTVRDLCDFPWLKVNL